jgi:hypothetical protein
MPVGRQKNTCLQVRKRAGARARGCVFLRLTEQDCGTARLTTTPRRTGHICSTAAALCSQCACFLCARYIFIASNTMRNRQKLSCCALYSCVLVFCAFLYNYIFADVCHHDLVNLFYFVFMWMLYLTIFYCQWFSCKLCRRSVRSGRHVLITRISTEVRHFLEFINNKLSFLNVACQAG